MITRRGAVFGMSLAALGSAASSSFGLLSGLPSGSFTVDDPLPKAGTVEAAVDNRLSREIARMAFRADSEEGVPVLLACIDQVRPSKAETAVPLHLTSWNIDIVSDIKQSAAAWQRLRPDCPPSDVARLIQVLAARDLAQGGKGQKA